MRVELLCLLATFGIFLKGLLYSHRRRKAISLQDKVVWITGASSGIGEALALRVATHGAKLVLSARRRDELERVARSTGLPEEDCLIVPLDMADASEFKEKVDTVMKHFSRIDVLINNAGVSQRSNFLDTTPETMKQIMDVNFFGPALLTRAVLPHMIESKAGHIVVISSVQGKFGLPKRTFYAASKHAVIGMFDSLRAEHQCNNIEVLVVTPGYIETNLSRNALKGDGAPTGALEAKKAMSSTKCADTIINSLCRGDTEVYVGGAKEWVALTLSWALPSVLKWIVREKQVCGLGRGCHAEHCHEWVRFLQSNRRIGYGSAPAD